MSEVSSLHLIHTGKVADVYDIGQMRGQEVVMIVRTDRVSGLNVKLSTPIPGKGVVLNQMSEWWMRGPLNGVVANHLTNIKPETILLPSEASSVKGRASVVEKLHPILVEAVVRRYLTGTGYKAYLKTGKVCGVQLPVGLLEGSRLDVPIFTPTEKSEKDPAITFEEMCVSLGNDLATKIRTVSLQIFEIAEEHLSSRGVILADAKFEFGQDVKGNLVLMDEVLTPDSSRFWLKESFELHKTVVSLDKQKIRDWLARKKESGEWDGTSTLALPPYLVAEVAKDYQNIYRIVTGK